MKKYGSLERLHYLDLLRIVNDQLDTRLLMRTELYLMIDEAKKLTPSAQRVIDQIILIALTIYNSEAENLSKMESLFDELELENGEIRLKEESK